MNENLIATWMEWATRNAEAGGLQRNLKKHLERLNAQLGAAHRINRLYEWRKGTVSVPDDVAQRMVADVLPYVSKKAASKAQAVRMCLPPGLQ